jgi:hypothetical protein
MANTDEILADRFDLPVPPRNEWIEMMLDMFSGLLACRHK